ncbi:hypothetical protein TURU_117521 [Turdus rufiventris]|nr:hypothetical protein TURU_117521 [Turdus rufiventris]
MRQKEPLVNGGIFKKSNGICCNSPWPKGDEQKHYAGRNTLKDCPTNTGILSFIKCSTGLLSIAERQDCLRLSMNFLFQYCAKFLLFEDIIKNTSKFLCLTQCCFQELLEGSEFGVVGVCAPRPAKTWWQWEYQDTPLNLDWQQVQNPPTFLSQLKNMMQAVEVQKTQHDQRDVMASMKGGFSDLAFSSSEKRLFNICHEDLKSVYWWVTKFALWSLVQPGAVVGGEQRLQFLAHPSLNRSME